MLTNHKLNGQNVSLRLPIPEDAPLYAVWLNDLRIALPLGDEAYNAITTDGMQDFIANANNAHLATFTICLKSDQTPIGRGLLFNIDHLNNSAWCGIFIGEAGQQGKGLGREALGLLLDYAFRLLNLNNITLGVFAFNQVAIRTYESLGFQPIGTRRQARLIDGSYHDVLLMDLLVADWQETFITPTINEVISSRKKA